jgi:hypothetical protein
MDAMYEVQKLVYYMLIHDLTILTPYRPFTSLPLAILVFNKLNTT